MRIGHVYADGPRLLLVEDEAELAGMLHGLFVDEGYTVDVAANGQTGLHYGLTRSYDVVVLDRRLPVVEGLELVRTWRQRGVIDPDPGAVGTGQPRRAGRGARRGRRGLPGQAVRHRGAAGPAACPAEAPPRPSPGAARPVRTPRSRHARGVRRRRHPSSAVRTRVRPARHARPPPAAGVLAPRPAGAGVSRGGEPGRGRHLRPLPTTQTRPRVVETIRGRGYRLGRR